MTGDEHRDLIERYYALVDAGQTEEMLRLFHDDIVYQRGRDVVLRGKEALTRFYEHDRIIADGRHELECVAADGDWVAVRGRARGVLRSGEEFTANFADFHQLRDDKIWRRYTYFMDRAV